ncbi:latent transforming growth factor beta-binding protein [Hyalangium rubrum]|uniref:Latent transforming growth factor beta-binding protein n=1 Tax=Hyalangium rubrum TaxID=3103134 RepID=A0ABU5H7G0_9BACT|nr:latent transforming growth factor beta-binding protein [Hyalangium sp. s54d21]MDY7229398.1 latent transforming growth factor beta-binding protein [Hyalangium sp. s54d21]
MRRPCLVLFAALASTVWLGCPLDIQVRCEDDPTCEEETPCEGSDCAEALNCDEDSHCRAGWRCNEAGKCEEGPRLGETCEGLDCQRLAVCHPLYHRCEYTCRADLECPSSYRCSPDSLCIEQCGGTPPETLGLTCRSSMDCVRCGVCVGSGSTKQCRQPCQRDEDCPGGAPGVCEQVGSGTHRACRLL